MEVLIHHFIGLFTTHFDLSYMLCVNVLTYTVIKIIDELNGSKKVSTWTKRIVMILSCVLITVIYNLHDYENKIILINSAIIAPVAWSWIFKPILKKLGADYKQINKNK